MKKQFTATAYIIHEDRVLLLFHPKLQKWLPPGGHVELDETPCDAAIREVKEETGLDIELFTDDHIKIDENNAKSLPRPYFCLLEEIPAFQNEPAHQHIDFIYLARPRSLIAASSLENHPLEWCTLNDLEKIPPQHLFDETKQVIGHILSKELLNC